MLDREWPLKKVFSSRQREREDSEQSTRFKDHMCPVQGPSMLTLWRRRRKRRRRRMWEEEEDEGGGGGRGGGGEGEGGVTFFEITLTIGGLVDH